MRPGRSLPTSIIDANSVAKVPMRELEIRTVMIVDQEPVVFDALSKLSTIRTVHAPDLELAIQIARREKPQVAFVGFAANRERRLLVQGALRDIFPALTLFAIPAGGGERHVADAIQQPPAVRRTRRRRRGGVAIEQAEPRILHVRRHDSFELPPPRPRVRTATTNDEVYNALSSSCDLVLIDGSWPQAAALVAIIRGLGLRVFVVHASPAVAALARVAGALGALGTDDLRDLDALAETPYELPPTPEVDASAIYILRVLASDIPHSYKMRILDDFLVLRETENRSTLSASRRLRIPRTTLNSKCDRIEAMRARR